MSVSGDSGSGAVIWQDDDSSRAREGSRHERTGGQPPWTGERNLEAAM
ncbi:MAG: hypothetical protein ACO1SX_03275 [Actinomycetota bacterium]